VCVWGGGGVAGLQIGRGQKRDSRVCALSLSQLLTVSCPPRPPSLRCPQAQELELRQAEAAQLKQKLQSQQAEGQEAADALEAQVQGLREEVAACQEAQKAATAEAEALEGEIVQIKEQVRTSERSCMHAYMHGSGCLRAGWVFQGEAPLMAFSAPVFGPHPSLSCRHDPSQIEAAKAESASLLAQRSEAEAKVEHLRALMMRRNEDPVAALQDQVGASRGVGGW
jgi:hypothetical protein